MELPLSTCLVILAGGEGRRLGGVLKPLLEDETKAALLDYQLDGLGPLMSEAVVVAPAPLIPMLEPVVRARARMIADEGAGPARAVVAAARALTTPWLFVVGGDVVRFETGLASRMLEMKDDPIEAVIPVVDGRRQPMFGLFARAAVVRAASCRSMNGLMASMKVLEIDGGDLHDVNVPEDLERFDLSTPKPPGSS